MFSSHVKVLNLKWVCPAILGDDNDEIPPLRPGHYTVKSREHGWECLRCGAKGNITDIKAKECPRPHASPNYGGVIEPVPPQGSSEAVLLPPSTSYDEQLLRDELEALKLIEEEYALLESIQAEQDALEALQKESAVLEVMSLPAGPGEAELQEKDLVDRMVADLVTLGFSFEMASWAIVESKADWEQAKDLAYTRTQEEEHAALVRQEEEEDRKHKLIKKARMVATPCSSPKTLPPPIKHVPENAQACN